MGWIKKVAKAHNCNVPKYKTPKYSIWVGSEWQCRKCKSIWIIDEVVPYGGDDEYLWKIKDDKRPKANEESVSPPKMYSEPMMRIDESGRIVPNSPPPPPA